MRRPEWAGTQTFAPAWMGAVGVLGRPDMRQGGEAALKLLEAARVVVVPAVQVLALPEFADTWEIGDVLAHERLPFDPLFIDYGYLSERDLFAKHSVQEAWDNIEDHGPWATPDEMRQVVGEDTVGPIVMTAQDTPEGMTGPAVMGFVRIHRRLWPGGMLAGAGGRPTGSDGEVRTDGGPCAVSEIPANGQQLGYTIWTEPIGRFGQEVVAIDRGYHGAALADVAARILRFLNCINVELVDAPVSRQERRAVERNGGHIAQIVRIKQNRRHRKPETEAKVDWSHRWEVRGHYKHFPEGTRLADAAPEKLSWEPGRQAYVRRIWCPPYVKGPEGRPLIPKTHAVVV